MVASAGMPQSFQDGVSMAQELKVREKQSERSDDLGVKEKEALAENTLKFEEEPKKHREAASKIWEGKDPEPYLFPMPSSKPGEWYIKI